MGYTLQAIIIPVSLREHAVKRGLSCVRLAGSDLCLIPLAADQIETLDIPFLPLTDGGKATIGPDLDTLCRAMSINVKFAYVEAEFFGGAGTQGFALYENGAPASAPTVHAEAINQALRWLGVRHESNKDEFDTIGLGTHRSTSGWLKTK